MVARSPQRLRDVARRLGLDLVETGGDELRLRGHPSGFDVSVQVQPAVPSNQGRWQDWAFVWEAKVAHPRLAGALCLVPSDPDPGYGEARLASSWASGDPVFDREVVIASDPAVAMAGLDVHNRRRIASLFDGGCATIRHQEIKFWRGGRHPDIEPVSFGHDLAGALAIGGRFTELDVVSGLLDIARNDPIAAAQLAAAEQLALIAPERLIEARRALDLLTDARFKDWKDGARLDRLLTIAAVTKRIDARLARRGERLLRRISIALSHHPHLIETLGEPTLVRLLLDGEGWIREPALTALEQRGESIAALRAAQKYTEGLLLGGEIKRAAKKASQAIAARVGVGAGQLSLAKGDGGGLALTEVGELGFSEDE